MLARPLVRQGGFVTDGVGPRPYLDQKAIAANVTVGNATLTVKDFITGVLNRTGPVGGFTDTWPNADDFLAAMDNPQKGDSWLFIYRNGVAQAMTFAAGTGIVSGIGTLNCAASSTKIYMHTLLSTKRSVIKVVTQVNATAVLTGLNNSDLAAVEQGMGASGTNIAGGSIVLGVTPSDTPGAASITLDQNVTASLSNNPVTFFPRITLDALGVMTN